MNLPKEISTVTPLSKLLAVMLFFSLPIVGFYFGIQYKAYIMESNRMPNSNIQIHPIIMPTLPAESQWIISDGSPQFMRELTFRVPSGWWFRQRANPYFGDTWTEIHPQNPGSDLSVFVLKAVTGQYEPTISRDFLTLIKEEPISISNYKGTLLIEKATAPTDPEITCPSCFLGKYSDGDTVAIATFRKGFNYYSFEGDISSYEKEFREILSSFALVEQE